MSDGEPEYFYAEWSGEEDDDEGGLPFDGSYDHLLGNTSTPTDGEERLTVREHTSAVLMTVSADTTEARVAIEDLSASLERLAEAARDVDGAMGRIENRDLTISISIDADAPTGYASTTKKCDGDSED